MSTSDMKAEILKLSAGIKTVKGANYQVVYANSSRMGISPWDIRVTLGQVVEIDAGQVNEDQVVVIMSPALAKLFMKNLTTTVEKYEEIFGPIKDPMSGGAVALAPKKAKKG
jgi:hypothetical protein